MSELGCDLADRVSSVTIVICYQAGTLPMMEVCLSAIKRFTPLYLYKVVVLCREGTVEEEARGFFFNQGAELVEVDVDLAPDVSSKIHGMMLDSYLPGSVATDIVLTLDSDCFPVAEGWISDMMDMLHPSIGGARVAGILHPWAPPPVEMDKAKIEWRVRSQHCWDSTHVACQMLYTEDLRYLVNMGARYNGGDDTGLLIPLVAKKEGWKVDGFKVSRCPVPSGVGATIAPEFNRYVCLVFGDKVYHHGGFSRMASFGDEQVFEKSFSWVEERVLKDGAEWLLDDDVSYRFRFDKEEEVAAEKMQRLFGMSSQKMRG